MSDKNLPLLSDLSGRAGNTYSYSIGGFAIG
jgi:hypothetical protein